MDNPRIVIMSDGCKTELFIDGEKVEMATLADFHFYAEPGHVDFEYEKYAKDGNKDFVLKNGEVLREKHYFDFGSGYNGRI